MPRNVDNMRTLATRHHAGQFRKDGVTPYIEHPKAVVSQLMEWGFAEEGYEWVLAIAWGHDLLEDTSCTCEEILEACGEQGRQVVNGIRLLTHDADVFATKDDYIRHVAENATPPLLAVKIADRICNTRDFIKLGRLDKARSYLQAGNVLLETFVNNPNGLAVPFPERITATIAATQAGIAALLSPH